MPKMDGTGPEGKGAKTGRKLGFCEPSAEASQEFKLGKGLGKKRHAGGGQGQGKRLRYYERNNH